jgi:lysozyme
MKTTALALTFFLALLPVSIHAQEELQPYPRISSGIQIEELEGQLPGAANANVKPRSILQLALDLIKVFEGWSSEAYNDPVGYCTIGFGHLIAKAKCENLSLGKYAVAMTKDEGNILLAEDSRPARLVIQDLVKPDLNKQQFGALTSFVFNVGGTNFAKSTLLKLLNENEFELAALELRKWTRAKDKVLPGLVVRRNCEISLFKGEQLTRLKNGMVDIDACGKSVGAAPDVGETIDIIAGEASN